MYLWYRREAHSHPCFEPNTVVLGQSRLEVLKESNTWRSASVGILMLHCLAVLLVSVYMLWGFLARSDSQYIWLLVLVPPMGSYCDAPNSLGLQ